MISDYSIHKITLIITSHILLMYLVADANNKLHATEQIIYYISLFITTYAIEFCAIMCTTNNNIRRQLNDYNILLPLVCVPVAFASMFIISFTIYSIISTMRVMTFIGFATAWSLYNKNFSCLIPLAVSYIPIVPALLHVNVIVGAILLVNYNSRALRHQQD